MKKIFLFILSIFLLFPFLACSTEKTEEDGNYISHHYFVILDSQKKVNNYNVYYIQNKVVCSYSLNEIKVQAFLERKDGEVVEYNEDKQTKRVSAFSEFYYDIYIDPETYDKLSGATIIFSGWSDTACTESMMLHQVKYVYNNGSDNKAEAIKTGTKINEPTSPVKSGYSFEGWYIDKNLTQKYDFSKTVNGDITLYAKYIKNLTITWVYNNGSTNKIETVKTGSKISKPQNPTKNNYIFEKWCTDKALTKEFDFNTSITSDITLYAKYIADYKNLTNQVTAEIAKCNVKIIVKQYNTFLGFETSSQTSIGSGVIFAQNDTNYFVLSNNHVVYNDGTYDKISYTIEDYKGNSYTATLKHNSAKYDLSVLYFKKGKETLGLIKRAKSNPSSNEEIIALTQPKGQNNAISFGEIIGYVSGPQLTCSKQESNVTFNVIKHDASINNGSSGGMMLNFNLELVGIHYAGSKDINGNTLYGYAIPISKVDEYLDTYIWSK